MKNKFFGSKLNSILLLVLIILMIIALFVMFKNKTDYINMWKQKTPVINNAIINNKNNQNYLSNQIEEIPEEGYFSGIITEKNNDCLVDATCTLELDNSVLIIYNPSRVSGQQPIGKIEGTLNVGENVEIYAKVATNIHSEVYKDVWTIIGSEKYYIKVVK